MDLLSYTRTDCPCGRPHTAGVTVETGPGALRSLPGLMRRLTGESGGAVFLLADPDTYAAAGRTAEALLTGAGIPVRLCVLSGRRPAPDERTAGEAFLHFDRAGCGAVLGVGSGVVNDIGKLLARASGLPYAVAATAPSMDGYASATSSMERGGLKVSLPSKCPDVIVGDTDVLAAAPEEMLRAGLGDMLAKYVALCEWRIAHLVTGEYWCGYVAGLVRKALDECVAGAPGLLRREPQAVEAVFRGLVLTGLAMSFAGLSRPASGVEHYFSHVWDMRGLAFGTPTRLHGVQCATATLTAVRLYERLRRVKPDRERALARAAAFDREAHFAMLRRLVGPGAEVMIAQEAREQKYDPERHRRRLEVILSGWDRILEILDEELPPADELEALMRAVGLPLTPAEAGLGGGLGDVFAATADIRDKYVLSRLVWDLGLGDELVP